MASIRHFPATHPLPDWRNFGVMLRVLLGVNALAAVAALLSAATPAQWLDRYVDYAALVEPLLLLMLGLLALARDVLWRLPLRLGQATVIGVCAALAWSQSLFWSSLGLGDAGAGWRVPLIGLVAAAFIVGYFDLRARAFSPAQNEARLAALNARIRPHFLFNTLNAALSLIRAQPQQAEAALEALADLFRAAMRDPAERVNLSAEIALARQYLDLEHLRLGDRLTVNWQIEAIPDELTIPPLMLQPLLENAVYHGIEPRPAGGTIDVTINRKGDELVISLSNPDAGTSGHPGGNQMALANLRERLALYYDLEARLEISTPPGQYCVKLVLPCRQRP